MPERTGATPGEVEAFVGLGSNLGDGRAHLAAALAALGELPGTRVLQCSSFYRSAPLLKTDQPDFLNAVAHVATGLGPRALLDALLAIESARGRVRAERNGPRTLDLDLLLYGDQVLELPGLVLPHPRIAERAFVLLPLAELDPALCVPGCGPVADLLGAVAGQRLERLPG